MKSLDKREWEYGVFKTSQTYREIATLFFMNDDLSTDNCC